MDADSYEPSQAQCRRAWDRLGLEAKRRRFAVALRRQAVVQQVTASVRAGESERGALKRLAPGANRSSYVKWRRKYEAFGLDGLIDWRMPPIRAKVTAEVRGAVCTLRRADPNVGVDVIVAHVAEHHGMQLSESTVKRILGDAGLSRPRGPANKGSAAGERRLELGGMGADPTSAHHDRENVIRLPSSVESVI